MENIAASLAIIFIIAIAFLVIGMGVTIVDWVTSEVEEPINIKCIVNDKFVDTHDGWTYYKLIVTDDEGNAKTISVTLEQYTNIEINDAITVAKTATKSIIFGTTYDYKVH